MTIDLGELPHAGSPVPAPATGRHLRWYAGRARRWVGRGWRPSAALVVAAALLLAVHTSEPPAPPWAELQFTVRGEPAYLGSETAYVARTVAPGRQSLAAYRLTDGARLWEVTRDDADRSTRTEDGHVVMHHGWFAVEDGFPLHISTSQIRRDGVWEQREASTTVLDPATGQPVWTGDGWPIGTAPDGLLLLEQPAPSGSVLRAKSAVHLATGDIAWRIDKEPGHTYHGGAHLVSHDHHGHLTSFHLETGARLASTALAVPGDGMHVLDEVVVIWQHGAPEIAAYDPGTLAPRWTADLPPDSAAHGCRSVVCVQGPHGVSVLDPASGDLWWSADWPPAGLGRRTARELPPSWPGSWVMLYTVDLEAGTATEHVQLLDLHTGEVTDLGGWRPVLDGPGHLLSQTTTGGRTWLGRLVTDPPEVEVLGILRGAGPCHATERHLACQVGDEVHVWQMRR